VVFRGSPSVAVRGGARGLACSPSFGGVRKRRNVADDNNSPRREGCTNNLPGPRRCQTSSLLLADVAEARGVRDARDGRGKPLGGCCE
jgi:hypothetical protein